MPVTEEKCNDKQIEMCFVNLDNENFAELFMRLILKELQEDDEPFERRARDLQKLYKHHGEKGGPVDMVLIALTGWSYDSLMKKAVEVHERTVEHEETEDYDAWDISELHS